MMKNKDSFFDIIFHFFPFQLLFWHLRMNLFALFGWVVLFAFISGGGAKFGVPYLFYSPEYLGEVSGASFLILGFGFGGFVTAFNLYSYIILGPYFPFIATVSRPFAKFSANNLIIPLIFLVYYGANLIPFQINQEFATFSGAIGYFIMFIFGAFIFMALAFFYFFRTNKDVFKLSGRSEQDFQEEFKSKPFKATLHKEVSWYKIFSRIKDDRHYYLGPWMKLRKSRDWMHYDRALIEKVFSQNHINASLFELFIIASFLILGIFRENDFFVVPAGASILLIFSIILMLISAVFSWLKTWTYVVLILLFLILNQFSKNSDFQQFNNHVYGLNYDVVTEDLNEQLAINMHSDLERAERDKDNYINALNNWKTRTGEDKPKLIIVNTSGGGARSALWTFIVLRQLDSLSNGKFSRQTQMITGASGGMLGAAYFRELMFRSTTDRSIKNQFAQFERNISKDLLNQVSFTITTNDLFYRYQNFDYNGIRYLKDRGYAFEQSFHKNTDFVLEKSLGDYTGPEQQGVIPVMIFSPTIVNDGRRLLISSLPAGYFQLNRLKMNGGYESILENFEYDVLLKPYQPENTRFSSVLRMSATFPYILPMVVLPGNMNFHVMDAGIRDNYGSKTTISFINVFKEWIKENTSGVVVVRIRDLKKNNTGVGKEQMSMIDKLFMPFGNMYGNFPFVQDFDQDENLALTIPNFDFPLDILSFNLRQSLDDKISLSWHLTAFEKDQVRKSFQSPVNEIEINRLLNLIGFNGGDSE